MKKITFVFLVLGIAALLQPTHAQMSFSLSGGSGFSSIPERSGNAHVSFLSSYAATSNLDLGLSIGFQHFIPTRFDNQYTNVIPLTLEVRYKLENEGVRPYALFELGVAQVDWKYREHVLYPVDFFEFMSIEPFTRRSKEWVPLVSLGVGALVPLTNQLSLDLGLRLGTIGGGAMTEETFIYGRVPETVPALQRNADSWNYFRLVIGVRADL